MYMRMLKLRLWFRLLICFFRRWFIADIMDPYKWETKRLEYDIQYQKEWNRVHKREKR